MPDGHPGRAALAHIDVALAARPMRDGEALMAAVQSLAAFRDACAERHRDDGGTRRRSALDHANAIVSVVLAAEFPLGEMPWAELVKARGWLDALLGDEPPQ